MTAVPKFLEGGGDSAREIAAYDWTRTPVGPISAWPDILKTTIAIMLRSGFPKALVWGQELTTFHNDAFRPILGQKPPAIGLPFSEVWKEAWNDIAPIAEAALAGRSTFIENFPLVINRSGVMEQAYFTFSYSAVADAEGTIVGFMDTVIETTQSVVEKQRSNVLNAELGHRIKNILSLVNSIVGQTLKSTPSATAAATAISHRLSALAGVQDVLRIGQRTQASIGETVSAAVSPHALEPGRVETGGPNMLLDDTKVLALSLALNELITNAIKYGALSNGDGKVEIHWNVDQSEKLHLTWKETGGPRVEEPSSRGFGTSLIQRHVASAFGGTAEIEFLPEGITYKIRP